MDLFCCALFNKLLDVFSTLVYIPVHPSVIDILFFGLQRHASNTIEIAQDNINLTFQSSYNKSEYSNYRSFLKWNTAYYAK